MDPAHLHVILVEDDPFNQEKIQVVPDGAGHTRDPDMRDVPIDLFSAVRRALEEVRS